MLESKFFHQDGKIVHKRTFDAQTTIDRVSALKSSGKVALGESRLVGSIPMPLVNEWIKEAGLTWDDGDAVQDMLKRKLLSGEYSKLRAWEGTF